MYAFDRIGMREKISNKDIEFQPHACLVYDGRWASFEQRLPLQFQIATCWLQLILRGASVLNLTGCGKKKA